MNKTAILDKLDKFCPDWINRPSADLSLEAVMEVVISQVLPGLLEVKVEQIDEEKIVGTAPYKNETANVVGYMHGGTIFTLGDTLAGTYLWAITDKDTIAVTANSSIQYLRPVKSGVVRCTVTEKSRKDRSVLLEAVFRNEKDQLVSKMTLDYLLMTTKNG